MPADTINFDACSKEILSVIEQNEEASKFMFVTDIPPRKFHKLLKKIQVVVGNSSSLVRDLGFTDTPGILIGQRQRGRELGKKVYKVSGYSAEELVIILGKAINRKEKRGKSVYGGEGSCDRIMRKIIEYIDKKEEPQKIRFRDIL